MYIHIYMYTYIYIHIYIYIYIYKGTTFGGADRTVKGIVCRTKGASRHRLLNEMLLVAENNTEVLIDTDFFTGVQQRLQVLFLLFIARLFYIYILVCWLYILISHWLAIFMWRIDFVIPVVLVYLSKHHHRRWILFHKSKLN
jgi:hypothetical protein